MRIQNPTICLNFKQCYSENVKKLIKGARITMGENGNYRDLMSGSRFLLWLAIFKILLEKHFSNGLKRLQNASISNKVGKNMRIV